MAYCKIQSRLKFPALQTKYLEHAPTRYWAGGDPIDTSIIDCLSIFLPEGEKFFIRSLKHYLPHIKNETVQEEIRGYSIQEAFHTREHEDYNQSLRDLGYDVDAMEEPIRKIMRSEKKPVFCLAATCAIEHFTMGFSMVTLSTPEMLKYAAAPYKRLWTWHAVEELEHSAVAIDVYNDVTSHWSSWNRYWLRVSAYNVIAINFARLYFSNLKTYAHNDGRKTGVRFWAALMWRLFGRPGYWLKAIPNMLRYYKPGYRPNPKHYAKLMQIGRDYIGRELPELTEDSRPLTAKG